MVTMQISENQIVNLILQLDLNMLEKVKKAIIKQEAYFKKFQKSPVHDILEDFKSEGYSSEFLNELENGLKNSSIYKK